MKKTKIKIKNKVDLYPGKTRMVKYRLPMHIRHWYYIGIKTNVRIGRVLKI
jgi:hypothetical protein